MQHVMQFGLCLKLPWCVLSTNMPIPELHTPIGDVYRDNQDYCTFFIHLCIKKLSRKVEFDFFQIELLVKKQNTVDNIAIEWQWSDNHVSVYECVILCSVISFVCNHLIYKLLRMAVYTDKSRATYH